MGDEIGRDVGVWLGIYGVCRQARADAALTGQHRARWPCMPGPSPQGRWLLSALRGSHTRHVVY